MDKPAQVFLRFSKAEDGGVWSALVGVAKEKAIQDTGDTMTAAILLKSYSLADGQFVHVKFNRDDGKELLALIPRGIVMMVVEGKSDLGKGRYFAGGTSKG